MIPRPDRLAAALGFAGLLAALGATRLEGGPDCAPDVSLIFQAEPRGSSPVPFDGAADRVDVDVPANAPAARHTVAAAIVSEILPCEVGSGLCRNAYTNCRGSTVTCDGVQGWMLSIALEGGLKLADAGMEGANPDLSCGFVSIRLLDPAVAGPDGKPQGQGVVGSVVFFCAVAASLFPRGTETALSLTLEDERPAPGKTVSGTLRPRDGLSDGKGISFTNTVVINGDSFSFCDSPEMTVRFAAAPAPFRRGDASADGEIDISDPIAILGWLFAGAAGPACPRSADADDNGAVEISDPIALLGHLFLGEAAPPAPFAACGLDPTPDPLDCDSFPPCAGAPGPGAE